MNRNINMKHLAGLCFTTIETQRFAELKTKLFNGHLFVCLTPEEENSSDFKEYNILLNKKMKRLKYLSETP